MSLFTRLRKTLPVEGMRIAGCCAITLVAMIAAPAGSALASNWTLGQLPPTPLEGGGTAEAGLSGVSCPSESLCVAVGAFDTVAFSQSPTSGANRWHVVYPTYDEPKQSCLATGESVDFCSSPRGSLGAVSCATESLCVAVGYEGSVYTSTDPTGGGAWSVTDVNEAHGGATHLTGVSCPSPSLCVAVSGGSNNSNGGKVLTSTNPISGNWQAIQLSSSLDLRGVSCGTPSLCVAVSREGRIFASTNPTGGTSAWQVVGMPGGPGDLEGVSCFSTLLCAAGNMTGNILTTTEPGGGSWSEANGGGSVQITGVSCPTVSNCAAVDNNGDVLTSADPTGGAGSWHFENLVPYGTAEHGQPHNALFAASCTSTSLCTLVGAEGRIFTSTKPFAAPADPPGRHGGHKAPRRPLTILLWAEHFWKVSGTRHRRLRARFRFYSPTKTKGFECKRDRGPYRPCDSPLRYWVRHGRHVLRVRAIGPTGLRGPAAIKHFRVTRPSAIARSKPRPGSVGQFSVGPMGQMQSLDPESPDLALHPSVEQFVGHFGEEIGELVPERDGFED